MTQEEEKLERLLDLDKEYMPLIQEINAFSGTKFPDDAQDLDYVRRRYYTQIPVEEFFVKFKCMVMWTVVMCRILDKIAGSSKYDENKSFKCGPANQKKWLIYFENAPRFYMSQQDTIAVDLPLRVFGGSNPELAIITFKIISPILLFDPRGMELRPTLSGSMMSVQVETSEKTFTDKFLVKDFDPRRVGLIIEASKIGEN